MFMEDSGPKMSEIELKREKEKRETEQYDLIYQL